MMFICPNCNQPKLTICRSIDLPGDARWDDISVQTVACSACEFSGAAVYRESRRGALDSEIVDHIGYAITRGDFILWDGLLATCPSPTNTHCICDAHRAFNVRKEYIWQMPRAIANTKSFLMKLI